MDKTDRDPEKFWRKGLTNVIRFFEPIWICAIIPRLQIFWAVMPKVAMGVVRSHNVPTQLQQQQQQQRVRDKAQSLVLNPVVGGSGLDHQPNQP